MTTRVRQTTSDHDLLAGRQLVLAVSADTSLPDPNLWPPARLEPHTANRQHTAESVWLATSATGQCVGHALVTPVPESSDHVTTTELRSAAREGLLFELGGLAVDARWRGQGIATALRDARTHQVLRRYPGARLITVCWAGGVSDRWYAKHWEPLTESVSPDGLPIRSYLHPRN